MWHLSFNLKKCKIIHIGSRNKNFEFTLSRQALKDVTEERDFSVIMSKDFKFSKQ